jgi:hypothetical protein
MLQHAVLNVDFVRLIARERGIEPVEQPVAAIGGELAFEQEIAGPSRIAEKQPVAASRAGRLTLLEKCAEWATPVSGPIMMSGRSGAGRRKPSPGLS